MIRILLTLYGFLGGYGVAHDDWKTVGAATIAALATLYVERLKEDEDG